jgi:hypothetical protein
MTHDLITKRPTTNQRKRPMNKLSRMIALLMLLTVATAYGTKYEYVRLISKEGAASDVLVLEAGDVAMVVNVTSNKYAYQNDIFTSGGYYEISVTTENGSVYIQRDFRDVGNLLEYHMNGIGDFPQIIGTSTMLTDQRLLVGPATIKISGTPNIGVAVSTLTINGLTVKQSPATAVITFRIERASQSGSTTLASGTGSNTNTSEGSGSGTETATTSTNYELLSSWCYFSEYPWVYSYTNNSWYYLMPSNSGLYAWNKNITGDWFNVGDN